MTAILQALGEARAGRARIVVSNLVLSEVRPRPEYKMDYKSIVEELLETDVPYMRWYGLPRSIAVRARDIGATFGELTPADCVHLATAIEAEADVFFTYDGDEKPPRRSKRLLSLDGRIKAKPGKPSLKIVTPRVSPGPLFTKP